MLQKQEKAKVIKTSGEIAEIAREDGEDIVDDELCVSGGNIASYCEEDVFCRQDQYRRDLAKAFAKVKTTCG